ncbi:MAG: DUF6152 family protein [Steroidobacteraceae bacterium]
MNFAIHKKILATALLSLLGAGIASAHHSAAMYDNTKVAEVSGTIKRIQIGNPHSWFWIQVANAAGSSDLWGFEGGSVADVSRKSGSTNTSDYFAVGQKVKVSFHPLRDGRQSGELLTITFEDGRVFGGGPGGPPPAGPSPGAPQ